MIARYIHLSTKPGVFKSMTGLRIPEFDALLRDVQPLLAKGRLDRLSYNGRKRAIGGGEKPHLDTRDQILMAVIWLRIYPNNEVLGYLFGVSDSTTSRVIGRVVPLLAKSGNDTFKMPDPGRKHRRTLPELLSEVPGLLDEVPDLDVIVDSFEQRVQRHKDRNEADTYFSGKKKQNTLKSQLSVDAITGQILHVSKSVKGPTSDLTLLKQSGLVEILPPLLKVGGDLGYPGLGKMLPERGYIPKRKPRSKDRPAEDIVYNTAFAKKRIVVEHSIGRVRRYQALTQMDRHHRNLHTERVMAAAGLANRQLEHRLTSYRLRAA